MKTKLKTSMALLASALLWVSCAGGGGTSPSAMDPVDYVNPYMGNISHLLVPTFPTVHLPNSMLRVYPERADFTGDRLGGLPISLQTIVSVLRSIYALIKVTNPACDP